jgi:BMFP domain-containing protein YqiC
MARLAREENEDLKARVSALEAKLGIKSPPSGPDDKPDTAEMRLDG